MIVDVISDRLFSLGKKEGNIRRYQFGDFKDIGVLGAGTAVGGTIGGFVGNRMAKKKALKSGLQKGSKEYKKMVRKGTTIGAGVGAAGGAATGFGVNVVRGRINDKITGLTLDAKSKGYKIDMLEKHLKKEKEYSEELLGFQDKYHRMMEEQDRDMGEVMDQNAELRKEIARLKRGNN